MFKAFPWFPGKQTFANRTQIVHHNANVSISSLLSLSLCCFYSMANLHVGQVGGGGADRRRDGQLLAGC